MTKNSGDWEGLQGHDDDPAQFKHEAWVHEGGVAYIYIYVSSPVSFERNVSWRWDTNRRENIGRDQVSQKPEQLSAFVLRPQMPGF